jgi:microcystin-dependent protein
MSAAIRAGYLVLAQRTGCVVAAALTLIGLPNYASAQSSDPFIGQIMCAAFTFAPQGWAELNGQLLSIQQNTALFSLLGTTYGGNGETTFALPDMRGRVLIHAGQGPGLTAHTQGESAGTEAVTLSVEQLPAHNHTVIPKGSLDQATLDSPAQAVPASAGGKKTSPLYAPGPGNVAMSSSLTTNTGGNAPVPVMQPYLTVKCFIALFGVFPSRP